MEITLIIQVTKIQTGKNETVFKRVFPGFKNLNVI